MKRELARIRGKLFTIWCKLFCRNVYIGNDLLLYKKLLIEGPGRIIIGDNCVVGGIKGDKSKYVTIDTHSPEANIRIGNNVRLYAARVSANYGISIGNDVVIEESGVLDTDFHSIDRSRGDAVHEVPESCRVTIGNNVCIGALSIVTKGVTIEDNVTVIPGSIVTKSIKSDCIVGGNPARNIK